MTKDELRSAVDNIETQSVQVSNCSFEMLRWIEDGPQSVKELLRDYDLLKASFEDNATETIQLREKLTTQWQRAERLKIAGAKLATFAFNLAQKTGYTLSSDNTTILDQLRKEWDAAVSV